MASQTSISIEAVGIADILLRFRLAVPLNQRPYAWEEDQVDKLFQDLTKAFDKQPLYFLGTIMFTHAKDGRIEVADGQQRLATISVLLAAMRDYLSELGDAEGANQYQSDFLIKYDPPSGGYKARLSLNSQDDNFFHDQILMPADKRPSSPKPIFSSNERLVEAAKLAAAHVRNITASFNTQAKKEKLYEWIDNLKTISLVIVVNVSAEVGNSFKMFETLNARGVQATLVDILKNYIFDKLPGQASRVHGHWLSMVSTIEAYGDDRLILTYIRHLWITLRGPTTVDELGLSFEGFLLNETRAMQFVALLDAAAPTYIALLTPLQAPEWEGLSSEARKALDIISNDLGGGEQIRPLMLAVARNFPKAEMETAFKTMLSWSVRFLIVGGGGGGKLDRYYGSRAKDITDGKIKTTKELVENMNGTVPRDRQFEEEFARANVRRANLARYYLRAIELYKNEDKQPQFLMNEDPDAVNLEHVMPVTPSDNWQIDAETAGAFYKRLGNMCLLKSKINVALGQKVFSEKKPVLAGAPYAVTKEIAEYEDWGPNEIKDRQAKLAKLAPKVWPLIWK